MPLKSEVTGNGRGTLLLIAGIPLAMIFAASWLWYVVTDGDVDLLSALGTSNNGALVTPPRELTNRPFSDAAGTVFYWSDVDPRWTLVVAAPGPVCGDVCERRIWLTRQIHVALGRDFNRVRRVLVTDVPPSDLPLDIPAPLPEGWPQGFESGSVSDYLALGHPGVIALEASSQDFDGLFSEVRSGEGGWYLVDPAGWVMMRFDDGLDYKAVITDLKFLLKNSGGG